MTCNSADACFMEAEPTGGSPIGGQRPGSAPRANRRKVRAPPAAAGPGIAADSKSGGLPDVHCAGFAAEARRRRDWPIESPEEAEHPSLHRSVSSGPIGTRPTSDKRGELLDHAGGSGYASKPGCVDALGDAFASRDSIVVCLDHHGQPPISPVFSGVGGTHSMRTA